MSARATECRGYIDRIALAGARAGRPLSFMEVCGTHTVNAFRSGLHSLMPEGVRLLSGPGCPVCVTAQGDIDQLVDLALSRKVTLCTYGDMIRVTGARGSLEVARCGGADVRVVYSALDAVQLAARERTRQVVFAAVGFETTAPSTAAAILQAEKERLTNFTVLASHKRVMPAMRALLDGGQVNVDGFLCPGHVSVIVGADAFAPLVEQYHLPCVIGGFEDVQIAQALARLAELAADGTPALENQYMQAVTADGNPLARQMIDQVFEPADVEWRALGILPQSGLVIRKRYALFSALVRFDLKPIASQEPAGCKCGQVITGQATPAQCALFGQVCTPIYPVGPCMVSSEGTCQAWFKYHRHAGATKPRLTVAEATP